MRAPVIPEGDGARTPSPGALDRLLSAPFSALVGALSAALWLVGRWSPGRAPGELPHEGPPLGQPRAAFAAAVLVLGLVASGLSAAPPRSADVRRCWRQLVIVGAAWFGWMLLSVAWAPDPRLAAHKALELLILGVGVVGLACALWRGDAPACRTGMLAAAMGGLGVLAAGGLLAGPMERAAAFGGGPNVFGRNCGVLVVLGLGAWRGGLGRGWLGVAGVASVFVVMSGSRGALGATLGGVLAFSLLSGRGLARRASVPLMVLVAAGAVLVLSPTLREATRDVFTWRVLELTLAQGQRGFRDEYFQLALELFASAPVRGAGLSGYATITGIPYPHNLPLEVACEGGLVGASLLLATTLLWVRLLWRLRPLDATALSAWVVLAGSAQLSGDLYDSRGLFTWGLLALAGGVGQSCGPDEPARVNADPRLAAAAAP